MLEDLAFSPSRWRRTRTIFGGHDEDDEENVFDWCHMVVLGIKGLTRFLVRSDPYQKCGKHTQKKNDGKSLAPKVYSKRDDDGGGNFKKL